MVELERFDYIVIGSGLAGLTFAIEASSHGTVCVLTKGEVSDSNTQWAQGGIAAAVGGEDTWELHEEDTSVAGAGLNDPEAVRKLVQEAPNAIAWLVSLGARFDESKGVLALGKEGGHSRHRIVHHADKTGWEIERALVETVRKNERITIFERAFVTSLLMEDGRCIGAAAQLEGYDDRFFSAKAVMLASGGCGRMFQHTTNPRVATADGIALAQQVGAKIEDMEFIQFHPTTLFHPQLRSFLISEAVRGAGATLRNHLGRRFMYDYDQRLELAPRDVVARAIDSEMKRLDTWCIYLDTTHLDRGLLRLEFPTIYDRLKSIDIEMEKEWIPVVPAQHYSCGGVVTNLNGQTSVPGLYASGEVARTGVHGANRLASNSLLEAIVFSKAAADSLESETYEPPTTADKPTFKCISESESIRIRRSLQRQMTLGAGIVRTDKGLKETIALIDNLFSEYARLPNAPYSAHPLETHNLLVAARAVAVGALARRTNIGLHFNSDLVETPGISPEQGDRTPTEMAEPISER